MGYPFTCRQSITYPFSFLRHAFSIFSFFYPTNPKLNLFHTDKKICCQVLPSLKPVFIKVSGFSMVLHNVCSSVRDASISGAFCISFSLNSIAEHAFFFSVLSAKNLLIHVAIAFNLFDNIMQT